MRAARVFRVVWRINGVLLLVAGVFLVAALAVGAAAFLSDALRSGRREASPPVAVVPEGGESLFLGRVEEVDGTPYVLLPLHAGERPGDFGDKFSSGGGSGRETRNLLFHDADKGTSRWLLPDHTTEIRAYQLLRPDGSDPRDAPEDGSAWKPVRWIRYELGPSMSPGAPEKGEEADETTTLAVSGPAGDGFTRVLEGVDEVLGYGPLRGTRQAVFFRRGGRHLAGEIDYATRRRVKGAPLLEP